MLCQIQIGFCQHRSAAMQLFVSKVAQANFIVLIKKSWPCSVSGSNAWLVGILTVQKQTIGWEHRQVFFQNGLPERAHEHCQNGVNPKT